MSARRAGPMEGSAHASDADPTKGRRLLFRQLPSQGTAGEGALHQPLLRRRRADRARRSEEHTSELQSQSNLVCRLLLEKKKIIRHSTLPLFSRERHATPPAWCPPNPSALASKRSLPAGLLRHLPPADALERHVYPVVAT